MEEKKKFIINSVYYFLLFTTFTLITYIIFKWFLPFVFSLAIVITLQPIIRSIQKMIKIKNKFITIIITIIVYLLILAGLIYLVFLGIIQIYHLSNNLPSYFSYVYSLVNKSMMFISVNKYISILYTGINEIITSFSTSFIGFMISLITSIPSLIFNLGIVVISSLFIIIDYDNIRAKILLIFQPHQTYVINIIGCIKDTISSLFKAYFIIFIITFIELLVSFYLIGVKDALMIAFGIALFDFFPILGLDMIMIPWIIILAINNNIALALGLLIIYGIIIVTKNVVEPKLIAKHIGIHPLVTIIGMFVGVQIFGILGIMIVPVVMTVVKRVYELNKEYQNE